MRSVARWFHDAPREAGALRDGMQLRMAGFRLQVLGVISRGGTATVYRVKDADKGTLYALKHLLVPPDSEELASAVYVELRLLLRLAGHPNVVRLVGKQEVASDKGGATEHFLLLEHCAESLVDALERRPGGFSEEDTLSCVSQVANALELLHTFSPPVAHRDLKAENVLLGADGNWKLCDFGSATNRAQRYESAAEIAREDDVIRRSTTPAYRAPEMWDLYRRDLVNEKVDMWALGCLLYRTAFAKSAFDGVDCKLAVLNGRLTLPEGSAHSSGLLGLIRELLTADPEARPCVRGVQQRLAKLLNATGAASTARVPSGGASHGICSAIGSSPTTPSHPHPLPPQPRLTASASQGSSHSAQSTPMPASAAAPCPPPSPSQVAAPTVRFESQAKGWSSEAQLPESSRVNAHRRSRSQPVCLQTFQPFPTAASNPFDLDPAPAAPASAGVAAAEAEANGAGAFVPRTNGWVSFDDPFGDNHATPFDDPFSDFQARVEPAAAAVAAASQLPVDELDPFNDFAKRCSLEQTRLPF